MASEYSSGERRSWNGLSVMNSVPKLELTPFMTNDWPGMSTVWATPGVSAAIFWMRSITATVRSSEAESGSWTLTMR